MSVSQFVIRPASQRPRSRTLLSTLLVGLTAAVASAQVELPVKPRDRSGSKPISTPAVTEPQDGQAEGNSAERLLHLGEPPPTKEWTMSRRTVAVKSRSMNRQQGRTGSGLELPSEARGRKPKKSGASKPVKKPATPKNQPGNRAAANAQLTATTDLGSATFVFDEVRKLRRVDDPVAVQAVDTLLALGERGFEAARLAIADPKSAPVVVVAARALLRSGNAQDAEQVVLRLSTRMPTSAAVPLVDSLVELDPVRATPELLGRLLDHPMGPIRQAASRNLEAVLTIDDLSVLRVALESSRKDARLHAIDLIASLNHPDTFDWLLEKIDDPVARVARRALDSLIRLKDPRTVDVLLERAFGGRWVLRPECYALLGLLQIEDRDFRAILDESHISVLGRGLAGSDPFVSGCCAAALAGVGFRSRDLEGTDWLDKEVPQVLVAIVSGETFFSDYSSMQGPAQSRLTLIAGVSYGAAGPKWATWWLANRDDFHASRAVLSVPQGAESRLEVSFQSAMSNATAFGLVGSGCDRTKLDSSDGELFFLTDTEAYDLIQVLRREGLFDATRLPGPRGGELSRGRQLELRLGKQAKTFLFGPGASEDWFERAVAAVRAVESRNLWQRFPDPAEHDDRHSFWLAESGFWSTVQDNSLRSARMKMLILKHAKGREPGDRGPAIDSFERLYETVENRESVDLPEIMTLLQGETYFGGHARSLARLARQSAGVDERQLQELDEADARVIHGGQIISKLMEHFGAPAGEEVASTLQGMGPAAVRVRAKAEHDLVRAICAELLGQYGGPTNIAALIELMRDPVPNVVATAALVAGSGKFAEALAPLTELATSHGKNVRTAAFKALGMLGGEGVQSILLDGLAEADEDLRRAAAEGLASLQDPSLSPLFISLVRKGRRSTTTEPARDGLRRLGALAHPDLLRALRSPSPDLQREAALLLSEQLQPDAASVLMRVLSEDSTDSAAARELSVLTCVDKRGSGDPASEWWIWWDTVKHNDSLAWFRAATERVGMVGPGPEEFEGAGTANAIAFLIDCMRLNEGYLVERARRQLGLMVGQELGDVPSAVAARDLWLETLLENLSASRN